MNWDDLRFVLTLAKAGSLARAAKTLQVDHTTVGRRVEAAEAALGVRLFTRTTTGYVPTADADRLLSPMKQVEEAVLAVERSAQAQQAGLEGTVGVTSPETFGACYLAPRLATFGMHHPHMKIELMATGEVLDLGRREAEIAVRHFRSNHEDLVAARVGDVAYGLYASNDYLKEHPLETKEALTDHALLCAPETNAIEAIWLKRLNPRAEARFLSTSSLALLAAAAAGAGVAVLPRYLGDAEAVLKYVKMPEEPTEPIWLTVHRDMKKTPRVRAVLDFLGETMKKDARVLQGG